MQSTPSRRATQAALTAAILLWALPLGAATTVQLGTDRSKQVIRGTLVTPTAVFTGELVIEGDLITCVAVDCAEPAGASIFTVTDGYIYPGFVVRTMAEAVS